MSSDPHDFDSRLATALAAIEKTRRKGLLWLAGLTVTVVAAIALVTALGAKQMSLLIMFLGYGGGGVMIFSWTGRQHKKLVMPLLAEQVGLTWTSPGEQVGVHLPPLILPAQKPSGHDMITGSLAGREFRFIDVLICESGADNDKIFKGFVLTIQQTEPTAAFFIVAEDLSSKWLKSALIAHGLKIAGTISASHHRVYQVWTPDGRGGPDAKTLTALVDLEGQFGAGSRLWSLRSGAGEFAISVRQSDRFLQVGGLFQSSDGLREDLAIALANLAMPLRVASAIVELEPRLIATLGSEKSSLGD